MGADRQDKSLPRLRLLLFPSYPSTTVAPRPGTWVIVRRPTGSDLSLVGRIVQLSNNVLSTMQDQGPWSVGRDLGRQHLCGELDVDDRRWPCRGDLCRIR
jgi:hypothetical protein